MLSYLGPPLDIRSQRQGSTAQQQQQVTVQVTVSVLVGTRHESVKDCEMRYTPDHIGVSPSLVTYHVTRDGRSFFFLVININVTSTTTYWKLRKADLG